MSNITRCLNHTNCTENSAKEDSSSLVWTAIQLMVFIVAITTALTGNALVCIAVYKFRQLQTTTNYAIFSLAITDVLMVYVMILHATTVVKGEWTLGVSLCDVTSTIGLTLNLVSLVHLAYISFDRYIAIVKPFRYQMWITKPRVVAIMVALWFSTCLLLNLPWADFKYRSNVFGCLNEVKRGMFRLSTFIILIVFVSFPTAFILFTHVSIFRIARRHALTLKREENNLNSSFPDHPHGIRRDDSIRSNTTSTGFKRQLKSVKTFGMVVGCFLICYIPFYTVATTRSFKGLDSVPKSVLTTVTWVGFFNSCINPILYSLRHHQFRNAFKKIFCQGVARILPLQTPRDRHRSPTGRSSEIEELSGSRDETFRVHKMSNTVINVQ